MTLNYESPSILELEIASEGGVLCASKDWDRADYGYEDNYMEGI